jgi:hypothetical protein
MTWTLIQARKKGNWRGMQLMVVRIGQGSSVIYQTVVEEMRHGVEML